jgi:DNA-damage-inducible protein D
MGSEELAANWFRITQANAKLRELAEEGITGKTVANQTHYGVGKEVRAAIERIGGTMPEELPMPTESIQELEKKAQQHIAAERQPSLFGSGEIPAEDPTEATDDKG